MFLTIVLLLEDCRTLDRRQLKNAAPSMCTSVVGMPIVRVLEGPDAENDHTLETSSSFETTAHDLLKCSGFTNIVPGDPRWASGRLELILEQSPMH